MDLKPAEDETLDSFFHGRIQILQNKKGYRFSVDAPLLADFIRPRAQDELLELGTGSGIISLLLSIKPFRHITALEVQGGLFALAQKNVRLNGLEKRISVLRQDLREFSSDLRFDLIFSNPPYYNRGRGMLSDSPEKSIAKHELKCDISDIMRKTAELLKPEGRACFVYPHGRKTDFVSALHAQGFEIRRERDVRPRADRPPNLFLSEAAWGPQPAHVEPPLVLFLEDGEYTQEAREIFAGR
jgi:tRNA1Val (adenine37-N6)-methyltransferase